jgi:PAS domain S-box-containing protein
MEDHYKTRDQLLAELEVAYRKIAELERVVKTVQLVEKSLQEYDDYFRIHFSLSNDVMYSYDHTYTLQYISPNVGRILGYKPEDLIGRKIFDLLKIIDPLDHNEVIEDAYHALSGHTILYSIYRFIAKDGSMKFGEVSGVPLTHDGKVVAVISVAREITDSASIEKSQNNSIRNETNHLRDRLSPQVLLDTCGIVLDLNEGAAKIFGKSINELVGSSLFNYTPENLAKKRKVNFDRITSSGQSDSFLEEYEGRIFYNTLAPICDEKGNVSRIEFNIQELSGKRYTPT